jgi:hypothetical protein
LELDTSSDNDGSLPQAHRHRRWRVDVEVLDLATTDVGLHKRRCRRWPTAACSSSTTSAGSALPREMLNRWIVPLESRIDHLSLKTGQVALFEVLVVFART